MTKNIISALLLSCISLESLAEHNRKFSQYPITNSIVTKKPLILDNDSKKYKTVLTELSKQPFNFSGHFVASTYGCGGGCTGLLVYNGKTGRSLLMKEQFRDCYTEKHGFTQNDIFYEKNSRLIIAVGTRTGQPHQCEEVHYLIEKDQFKQIKQKWLYK